MFKNLFKQAAAGAGTPVPEFPAALTEYFRVAVYGYTCRTRAFAMPGTRPQAPYTAWREAVMTGAPDSWSIIEVCDLQDGRRDRQPRAERQSFWQAVQALALYETSQDCLYQSTGPDSAAMGFDHYRAFAVREGIAFDETDMPHPPTPQGQIVTAGQFTAAMEAAVAQAARKKLTDAGKYGLIVNPVLALISPVAPVEDGGASLFRSLETQKLIGTLGLHMQTMIYLLQKHIEKDFYFDYKDYSTRYYIVRDVKFANWNLTDLAKDFTHHQLLAMSKKLLDQKEAKCIDAALREKFLQQLNQIYIFFLLADAKDFACYLRKTENLHQIAGLENRLVALQKEAKAQKLGSDKIDELMTSALNGEKVTAVPPAFPEYVAFWENVYDQAAAGSRKEWAKFERTPAQTLPVAENKPS